MSGCERVAVAQTVGDGVGSAAIGLIGIDLDGHLLQLSNQHIQQLRAGVRRLGYHRCGIKDAPAPATPVLAQESSAGGGREARRALSRGSKRESDRRTDRGDES